MRTLDTRTGKTQPWAAFEWAEPADEVLSWAARQPKLLAELQRAQADVICLQEVQFERQPTMPDGVDGSSGDGAAAEAVASGSKTKAKAAAKAAYQANFALPRWLVEGMEGYAAIIPKDLSGIAKRNARVLNAEIPIGNAILYNTKRLELAGDNASAKKLQDTTRVGVGLQGVGMLAALQPTTFVSVHLDATSEEKRVKQLSGAVEMGKKMGIQNLVIAGDFNVDVVPGTCVNEMLGGTSEPTAAQVAAECKASLRLDAAQEPTAENMAEWEALRATARNGVSDGYRDVSLGQPDNSVTPFLPRTCSRTLMNCFAPLRRLLRPPFYNPSVTSRCSTLLPSASADARSSDDVIAF